MNNIAQLSQEPQWKGTDFVFLPGSEQMVQVKEILSLEVDQNYTRVTIESGGVFLIRRSLKACESRLDPKVFVRANREWLVNLGSVKEIRAWDAKRLVFVLTNGKEIPLSRSSTVLLRKNFSL